jgi:hypothetical protein
MVRLRNVSTQTPSCRAFNCMEPVHTYVARSASRWTSDSRRISASTSLASPISGAGVRVVKSKR